jgi:hypothetical protein
VTVEAAINFLDDKNQFDATKDTNIFVDKMTCKSTVAAIIMSSEETPMHLEEEQQEQGHAVVVKRAAVNNENDEEAVEISSYDHAAKAREREQMRQMMAEMLGLERLAHDGEEFTSPSLAEHADDNAGSGAKLWSKDQHIAMVADALAKELTTFREQNGLEGTPEELAHLNQFLAIDYEMLKPHMRQTS